MTKYDFYTYGDNIHFGRHDMTRGDAERYAIEFGLWFEVVKNPKVIV